MFVRSLAGIDVDPVVKAYGITFETQSGKKLYDLTVGTLCLPFGYAWRDSLGMSAATAIDNLPYASSRFGTTYVRDFANRFQPLIPAELSVINPKMCNGSDAVETAIKAARVYSGREGIAVVRGAWHGETDLCLSLSSRAFLRPISARPNIHISKEMTVSSVTELVHQKKYDLGCVVLDPIGFSCGLFDESTLADDLAELKVACDIYDIPLIFDEVQTAIFTYPYFTAMQKYNVVPDIAAFGKGIGFGVAPVACTAFTSKFRDALQYNEAEFTYGALPASLAVAIKGLQLLKDRNDAIDRTIGVSTSFIDRMKEKYSEDFEIRTNGVFMTVSPKSRYFSGDWTADFVKSAYVAGIVVRSNDAANRIAIKLPIYHNPAYDTMSLAEVIFKKCIKDSRPFVRHVNSRGFDNETSGATSSNTNFNIKNKPLVTNKNLAYLQTIFDAIGANVEVTMRNPLEQELISQGLNDIGFPIQRLYSSADGKSVFYHWVDGKSLDVAVAEGLKGDDLVGVLLRHQRLLEHANDNGFVIADRWAGNIVINDNLDITFIDLDIKLCGASQSELIIADETFALIQSCALAVKAGLQTVQEAVEVLVPRYLSRHGKDGKNMLEKVALYYTHQNKPSNSSSYPLETYEQATTCISRYLKLRYNNFRQFPVTPNLSLVANA
jgi:acetylornithine/succinyldiaminopimelate/putrescine aminotransferase